MSSSLFFDSSDVYRNRQPPAVLAALHGGGGSDESRLVGMQSDRDKIIGWLDDDSASDGGRLRVICIVGFGGLGKTTLAKAVYDSPAVMRGMGSRAFITVSKTYDERLLLESIVRELVPRPRVEDEDPLQGIELWDTSRLTDKSRHHLANKRLYITAILSISFIITKILHA
jgi:disease resistance protein RPM1